MFTDAEFIDPNLAIRIYFGFEIFHVAASLLIRFVYTQNGAILYFKKAADTSYWWVYMSGDISFNLDWLPVMLLYPFVYVDDINWKEVYLIASMASIDGLMLGEIETDVDHAGVRLSHKTKSLLDCFCNI